MDNAQALTNNYSASANTQMNSLDYIEVTVMLQDNK